MNMTNVIQRHSSKIVLLTGATGFVGRQVLKILLQKGIKVRVVIRDGNQSELGIFDGVESIVTTIDLFAETSEWWTNVCKDIGTVIHVAWYSEPGKYLQSFRNLDCLSGTLALAKGVVQSGVKRFVGIGTCFEYDPTSGRLSTDTPLRPSTLYAGTKVSVFTTLSQWLPLQGIEFAWCRLFYLHGEGEDLRRLVPYLRSKLAAGEIAELTSGNQIRDFLDVREAGKMIVKTVLSDKNGPINICSGQPITIRQLAEQIADEYGRRDLLKFGARPDNIVDPPCIVGEV